MINEPILRWFFEPRAERNYKHGNPHHSQFCQWPYKDYPKWELHRADVIKRLYELANSFGSKIAFSYQTNDISYNYFHQFFDIHVDAGTSAALFLNFLLDSGIKYRLYRSWRWDHSTNPATCIDRIRIWIYAIDKDNPNWKVYDIMYETIKKDLLEARKSNSSKKSILQVLLGEIQLVESREAKPLTNEEIIAIVRKLKKSVDESFEKSGKMIEYSFESAVLEGYLPQTATKEEILETLAKTELYTEILEAPNAAKFIGQANALLKELGVVAEGKDVAEVVRGIKK